MAGLQDSIASFSAELRAFAAQTTEGISNLRRNFNSKPCIGPTAFRESCEELARQAAVISADVQTLETVTLDAVSTQELLSQCLELHKDSQRRIMELDMRLRQYGLKAEYQGPIIEDIDDLATLADAHANVACSQGLETEVNKKSLDTVTSPDVLGQPLDDVMGGDYVAAQHMDVTPSPVLSSSVSMTSLSPSLRELQRKYAASTEPSTASKAPMHSISGLERTEDGKEQTDFTDAPTPAIIGRKLAYLALEMPGGALRDPPNEDLQQAKKVDHLALEHPRFSPTNRGAIDSADADPPTPTSAALCSCVGDMLASAAPKSTAKKDNMNARLAAGEPPWDMLSLKAAIHHAVPGTGKVAHMIGSASFQPQAAAFTSLLHMCAKSRLWQKALEVFQAMRDYHPSVRPNTVHYSSLISACATAGRWEEAMQVFLHMKAANDSSCAPNVITYSALMTACCAGGRVDKAFEVFKSMKLDGVVPDHICYSTLIAGFERNGDAEMARQIAEEMQAAGIQSAVPCPQAPATQQKLPQYIEQLQRKIRPVNLVSPRLGGPNQATPPLSPTQAGLLLHAAASGMTPHHTWAQQQQQYQPTSPSAGNQALQDQILSQLILQTPQLGHDRSEFIPANYGTMHSERHTYGVSVEESTLELRKAVLHTRSPSTAFQGFTMHDVSGMAAQTPHMPSAPGFAATPQLSVNNQNRTPSTAELLRAAHSGSTAQLGRHLHALQQAAAHAEQQRSAFMFAAAQSGEAVPGNSPTKAVEGFSLFQTEPTASNVHNAPTPQVMPSPFAQQAQSQHVQMQQQQLYGSLLHNAEAAEKPQVPFDAAPGGSTLAARRTASMQITRGHSRSFDTAPGSPLAARTSSTVSESGQQATWQSSLDRARGLNHTRSQPLYSNIVAQNTHFQSQTSANPAHLGSGWSGQQQQQQPGSIMHSNTGGGSSGAITLPSQPSVHSPATSDFHPTASTSWGSNSGMAVEPHTGSEPGAAAQHFAEQPSGSGFSMAAFSAMGSGVTAAVQQPGGNFRATSSLTAQGSSSWAEKVAMPEAGAARKQPPPQLQIGTHALSCTRPKYSPPGISQHAPASPVHVTAEEFVKLPLRVSRQVNLGTVNEGLNFIVSSIRAKSDRGLAVPASGLTEDELKQLNLSHNQMTALLQSLLQLKRLQLVSISGKRVYTLP